MQLTERAVVVDVDDEVSWFEISIAGCVKEMVRDPNLMPFFSIFSFFHVLCFIHHLGTKTTCSASDGKEKPP